MGILLSFLGGNWRWLAIVAALTAGWLYISHLNSTVDRLAKDNVILQSTITTYAETNDENLRQLDTLQKQCRVDIGAVERKCAADTKIDNTVTVIQEKVRHVPVPASACTAVDPRLRALIGELRSLPGAGGGDQDRDRKNPGPGKPAVVSSSPARSG